MRAVPVSALTLSILFLLACLAAVLVMFSSASGGAGLLVIISRLLPWTRREIFREDRQAKAEGFTTHASLDHLVGREGRVEADLHPVGKARFGDEVVTAVSEGEFLRRGQQVMAVAVRGGQVVVRQLPK